MSQSKAPLFMLRSIDFCRVGDGETLDVQLSCSLFTKVMTLEFDLILHKVLFKEHVIRIFTALPGVNSNIGPVPFTESWY